MWTKAGGGITYSEESRIPNLYCLLGDKMIRKFRKQSPQSLSPSDCDGEAEGQMQEDKARYGEQSRNIINCELMAGEPWDENKERDENLY